MDAEGCRAFGPSKVSSLGEDLKGRLQIQRRVLLDCCFMAKELDFFSDEISDHGAVSICVGVVAFRVLHFTTSRLIKTATAGTQLITPVNPRMESW